MHWQFSTWPIQEHPRGLSCFRLLFSLNAHDWTLADQSCNSADLLSLLLLQNLERLHQTFLPTLLDFVKLFYNVFMHEDAPKEKTEDHRRHFVKWIKGLFATYFDIVRNVLEESYSAPSAVFQSDSMTLEEKEKEMGHGALNMKSALEIMSSDMSVVYAQIPDGQDDCHS